MILVDTCVWSLALRRAGPGRALGGAATTLRALIEASEPIAIPGMVLQELLSGVRERAQYQRLDRALAPFPLLLATRADHLLAADLSNTCRRAGITVSAPDCLIAAQAIENHAILLTTDIDFTRIAAHCNLRLMKP